MSEARTLCWEVPHKVGDDVVGALVEGTLLRAYRFDRYRPPAPAERTRRCFATSNAPSVNA